MPEVRQLSCPNCGAPLQIQDAAHIKTAVCQSCGSQIDLTDPALGILGQFVHGFAPPRTEDILTNAGGVVDLEAELSWNSELGMRYQGARGLRAEVTLFQLDFSNQIVPASVAGGSGAALTSAGRTLHRGVEFAARIGTDAWTDSRHLGWLEVAWTWLPVARFEGARYAWIGTTAPDVPGKVYLAQNAAGTRTPVSVTGNRLPYAPEHLLTAAANYAWDDRFELRLEAAHSHAPAERFLLVEKTWSAEDLVGRQIEIAFAPAGTRVLEDVLASKHGQRVFFVPVLAVRGPDTDAAATQALSAVGDPFAVTGQVLREEAGRVTLDGQPLPLPDPPGDAPRIASLDLAVNAAAFPLVTLELTPSDAQGNIIENLSAAHFLVEEDGRPVPALMERWARPAPRVLLLLDDSGSIPKDFRAEGAQALAQDLATQLKAADPRAQFRIAKVDWERASVGKNAWTDDPAALPAQVQNVSGYGSRLWEALADAARHSPTVIALVTDGQATDANEQVISEPPALPLAAVQAGPPAVVIGVGEVDTAMLQRLGQAGRLGAFTAATRDEAIQAVLAALRDNPPPPYRLSYRAPDGSGSAPRAVRVFERYGAARRPGKTLLAEARYTPPPPAQRAAGAALSGLFLTVQVGDQVVTRTLGGLSTRRNDESPTAGHIADVRRALQGRATLTFEAGAPSLAHLLDDCYTALLSLQPVFEARTRAERLAALAGSPIYLPPVDLHVASIPLPGRADEPLTFEAGLRAALHRVLPGQTADGQPAAVRWLDLLPLAGFRTADADSARAFRLTAQRTARLALAEALIFPKSTVAVMKDKPLRAARTISDIENAPRTASADDAALRRVSDLFAPWLAQRHTILWSPDAGLAGWSVDEQGSVWGVLGGDGAATAGGGSSPSPTTILDGALLISDLAALAGLGGFSFAGGVWLLLASTLYKKLEAATALLAQLPTSPDDPAPDVSGAERIADPSDVVCGLAQSAAFEAISRVGGAFFGEWFSRVVSGVSALDGARSMATGSGFFC
ncbi:MAG: TonB-dependent receptor [Anaerolineae bacterium]|nr:TonB-dependent receptor [Anaerolineae bacterium]